MKQNVDIYAQPEILTAKKYILFYIILMNRSRYIFLWDQKLLLIQHLPIRANKT
jgi:hypothetical protein